MNAYEYILKLKDYASSGLRKVAASAGVADNKLHGINKTMGESNRRTKTWSNSLGGLKRGLVAVFSVAAISMFTSKVVGARAEYEKFDAVLTNTFQSKAIGEGALNMLTDFAAKTPFQLNELTGSFVKLVNRGFNPANTELTKMGDLASSQGKSFNQLTEAILDAETNEFERLKEFGIKTKKSGGQVELSFKGITKSVKANGDSIRKAILEYGAMKGVAGSMEAISKTLGGRISNLKDQWWSFLVAVGGQSSGVFSGFIEMASAGLVFITKYLPHISVWFTELWNIITPLVTSFAVFFKQMFGFKGASDLVSSFGNVMLWVLSIIDLIATGLPMLFGNFKGLIIAATSAWIGFNAVMAMTPLGWIVMGIMAISAAIGLVSKYTSGWAESWSALVNGAKLLWQGFGDFVHMKFTTVMEGLMIGVDQLLKVYYKAKNYLGIGDDSENRVMLNNLNKSIKLREEAINASNKRLLETSKKAGAEFAKMGITIDKEGMQHDFANFKSKFSNLGVKKGDSSAYTDGFLSKQKGGSKSTQKGIPKASSNTIISGGKKMTNINVTINKLQDYIQINANSSEKGIQDLEKKVQEVVLRAINSVNQMQTS